MSEETKSAEQWGVVELFGHQKIAGKISEETIGGCSFVRVDVPALPERHVNHYGSPERQGPIAGYTKLFGQGAIYAITFVDEILATGTAAALRVMPIESYTLRDVVRAASPTALRKLLETPDDDQTQD
jgi:hypothetical protein